MLRCIRCRPIMGSFAALPCSCRCCVVYRVRRAAGRMRWRKRSALAGLPADVAADALQARRSAARHLQCRRGQHSGAADAELKAAAADAYARRTDAGQLGRDGARRAVSAVLGDRLRHQPRIGGRSGRATHSSGSSESSCSSARRVAVLTTIGIVFSVLFETYRFFFDPAIKGKPSVFEFLFGTEWNPQAAHARRPGRHHDRLRLRAAADRHAAHHLHRHLRRRPARVCSPRSIWPNTRPRASRAVAKPVLEILAGIPTVVLGFFAALTVAPLIRGWGERFGLDVASESALAAGLVMGMMIIPFISSLSDDVINAVPQIAARRRLRAGRDEIRNDQASGAAGGACPASFRPSCSRSAAPSAKP